MENKKKKETACRLNFLPAVLLVCLLFLSGCSKVTQADIQFTTGLSEHELFKIGQEVCTQQQAAVLLASQRNSYEAVYGDGIWKIPVGGSDFEGVVLDSMKLRNGGSERLPLSSASLPIRKSCPMPA